MRKAKIGSFVLVAALILLLAAQVALSVGSPATAEAEPLGTVEFISNPVAGNGGTEVTIPVGVEAGSEISCFQMKLLYDSGRLEFSRIATAYGTTGEIAYRSLIIGDAEGSLGINYTQTENMTEANILFVMYFRIKDISAVTAGASSVIALDQTYDNIAYTINDAGESVLCANIAYSGGEIVTGILGDANLDGVVNINDVILIRNYIVGKQTLMPQGVILADFDQDGDIDVMDVSKIQLMLAGSPRIVPIYYMDTDGTLIDNDYVAEGSRLTAPSEPSKPGYSFAGWSADTEGTTIWDFASDRVILRGGDACLNLYAVWEEGIYTLRGKVYLYDGTLRSNASVSLVRGAETYSDYTLSDGSYAFTSLGSGEYTLRVGYTGYSIVEINLTVVRNTVQDVYLDLDVSGSLSGRIYQADSDTDLSNNEPLPGVNVNLLKRTGTNVYNRIIVSGAAGAYSFTNLTAGEYLLTASKSGYITIAQNIYIYANQTTYTNIALELIEGSAAVTGNASGTVFDAATGLGVEGLTLRIIAGIDNLTGASVATRMTTTDGSYQTEALPAGYYTVLIEDNRSLASEDRRYFDNYFNIKVLPGETVANQNGYVNRVLLSGELRVVLTWGATPLDLDSHMTGPKAGGGLFHTYYASKNYSTGGETVAFLDLDDVTSYGPETTTVYNPVAGTYKFLVHDYSNMHSSYSEAMANSGATVKVYLGGTLANVFYVPNTDGTLWEVCSYNTVTGEITAINNVSYHSSSTASIG